MIPSPIALGLTLCEKVIVEEGTKNATLVSSFTKMFADEFPSPPPRFCIYAALIDGLGNAMIDVVVTRLDTDVEIYRHRSTIFFPDRLVETRVLLRVTRCSFPAPGKYQFTILIDDEWIAQRELQVARRDS